MYVMELLVTAVAANPSSLNQIPGRNLVHGPESTPPCSIGISIDSPERLSVMVMDSFKSSLRSFYKLHVIGKICDLGHFAKSFYRLRKSFLSSRVGYCYGGAFGVFLFWIEGNLVQLKLPFWCPLDV